MTESRVLRTKGFKTIPMSHPPANLQVTSSQGANPRLHTKDAMEATYAQEKRHKGEPANINQT
jgi:hypothetical protein